MSTSHHVGVDMVDMCRVTAPWCPKLFPAIDLYVDHLVVWNVLYSTMFGIMNLLFFGKGGWNYVMLLIGGMFSRGFACEAGFSTFNDHFRRYTPCPDTLIWTIATMQSWQQRRSPLSFRLEAAALLTPPWFMVPVMVSSWFLMGLFWDRIFMHSNISKCKHWVFFLMFLMEVQIFGRVTALDRVNCVFPIHIVNLRNLGLWPRIHRWVA